MLDEPAVAFDLHPTEVVVDDEVVEPLRVTLHDDVRIVDRPVRRLPVDERRDLVANAELESPSRGDRCQDDVDRVREPSG